MKFSISNMAKIGMFVLFLNLCPSLQASQQDIYSTLKNLKSSGFDCKVHEVIVPEWLVKDKIVPNSVVESEELWRFNAIFLKDALQISAYGSTGNEIVVISDRIIDNAEQIGQFLGRYSPLEEEISNVKFYIIAQSFTLYAYTIASKFDSSEVPELESLLQNQNENLLNSLSLILKARGKERGILATLLSNRLEILKDVSNGFTYADESEDFTNAYKAFNKSLLAEQAVGAFIGWSFFDEH